MSESHIKNLESASSNASINVLLRIANTLNVSIDVLLIDSLHRTVKRKALSHKIMQELENCTNHELNIYFELLVALKNGLNKLDE